MRCGDLPEANVRWVETFPRANVGWVETFPTVGIIPKWSCFTSTLNFLCIS